MSKLAGLTLAVLALPVLALSTSSGDPSVPDATPPVAAAAPGKNVTYFSDPFFSTVVGQFGTDCCNNPVAWGTKTAFSVSGGCFPCFPPPR